MSDGLRARVRERRAAAAVGVACLGYVGCVAWAVVAAQRGHFGGLSIVLLFAAIAAGLGVARVRQNSVHVSPSFLVYILAAAFLGPTQAFIAAGISELTATRVLPTRRQACLFNLLGSALPALLAGTIMRDLAPHDREAISFYLVLGVLALGTLELSWFIVAPLFILYDGYSEAWSPRTLIEHLPSALITAGLTVAGAAIYVKVGLAGIVFALLAVFAFSYMSHLLERARHRSEQYVALSWGVLSGLMRALDVRDERAARHAAAVARFSRDMAHAVGMSEHECELAHTAGLLHDIGRFALSDRVAERDRQLSDEDWTAIYEHPELGADMLRDLGMYGPVAQIVLAHHERMDGRGYPNGLRADEIPEIAKIIAVSEVYDTLTASDTYRTRMSSFEALRELRRVGGTQLDAGYVEVLAKLLTGEGVEYRHADSADFDTELDMERRIKEAGTG